MKKYLFLLLMVGAVTFTACNSGSSKSNAANENAVETAQDAEEQHATLWVGGSCDMCTDRIVNTVNGVEGVTLAEYNLDGEELHVHFAANKTNLDEIAKTLAAVGHDTEAHKADDAVYEALPGCCHYRK